jgi:hypothetical protein
MIIRNLTGKINLTGNMYVNILQDVVTDVCLCGLVVRVSGYRSGGPGFFSRRFQIFSEAAGLERDPVSLVEDN